MRKSKWMVVLWPSFLIAGIAEGAFFSLINPQELYLLGQPVDYSPLATYTIGFFAFWALCSLSSLVSVYLWRDDPTTSPLATRHSHGSQ